MKKKLSLFLAVITAVAVAFPSFTAHGEIETDTTPIEISAPSAVLMDSGTGQVLFEKNSHEIRPCASITKVMTLCLTFEAIESGRLAFDTVLTASAHASSMGGSDIWLKEGETMTVDDLLKATVIMSANDAAVVLAENIAGSESAFVQQMNQKAKELGMNDTVFKNCNGLDEDGHVTSAYDVALMSRELIKHKKIFDYTLTWIDYIRDGATQLVNTNKLIRSYTGITGLKTGTTSKAGSCIAATAERDSLHLISVILGADSTDNRFKDAAALLDYGFANWAVDIPETPTIEPVIVFGGMEETVKVKVGNMPKILIKSSQRGSVEQTVEIDANIAAPIAEGDVLGKVVFNVDGKIVAETEIRAAENVEKITFSSSFGYLLQSFFTM